MKQIELKDSIAALRKELTESILESQGEAVRFEVGEIKLEFQVEIEKSGEGKGGIKFWVVELGASGSTKDKAIHKVTIPLKPINIRGGPIFTRNEEVPKSADIEIPKKG